jgi:hypothetical protein
MYTSTTIVDPSPQAEALSREILNVFDEHRAKDPDLGIPDTLVALELAKASVLEKFGISLPRTWGVLVTALLLLASVGVAFIVMQ